MVGIALLWGVRGGELGRAEGEGEKPNTKTFARELVWGAIVVRVSKEVTNQTRVTARIFDALWFLTFFSCLAMYVWKKKEWC